MDEDMIFTPSEVERYEREAALYGDQPADMTIFAEEVYGTEAAREMGMAGGADMEFTLEEVHAAERAQLPEHAPGGDGHGGNAEHAPGGHGGEHGGGGHAEHSNPMHTLHGVHMAADTVHAVAEGVHHGHHIAEAAHHSAQAAQALEAGVVLPEAAPGIVAPALAGAGIVLGPLGAVLGGNQLGEGIVNDDAGEAFGGLLGIGSGVATTVSSALTLAGTGGALAATAEVAAPLAASAAVGYGVGRLLDGPVGELQGGISRNVMSEEQEVNAAREAQRRVNSDDGLERAAGGAGMRLNALHGGRREQTQRGLGGGTEVVDNNDSVSDRLAEVAIGGRTTGAISDEEIDREYENGRFGRDLATYLPTMLGGDTPTAEYFGF